MFTLRRLFFGLAFACFLVGNAAAGIIATSPTSHNIFTQSLKPIPKAYQIAKSTFLPDSFDDLGLSGHENTKYDYNKGDQCAGYPLSACPAGGSCMRCPFNHKRYRITSCKSPYIKGDETCVCPAAKPLICKNDKCTQYCGSTCIAKSCSPTPDQTNCTNGTRACDNGCCANTGKCCVPCANKITTKPENSSYTTSSCTDGSGSHSIQTGWKCNSGFHQSGSTCTKDCIVQSCSGYSLTECPADKICSSCTRTAANCSTDGTYYQITGCKNNLTDTDTFWCSKPTTTDCSTLGYNRSSGSCGTLTPIACPFDTSRIACIDFN